MEPRKYEILRRHGIIFLDGILCPENNPEWFDFKMLREDKMPLDKLVYCGDWCPHFDYHPEYPNHPGGYGPHVIITCSGIEKIIEVQEAE